MTYIIYSSQWPKFIMSTPLSDQSTLSTPLYDQISIVYSI